MLALNLLTGSVLLSTTLINALPFVYNANKSAKVAAITTPEKNLVQAIGEEPHSFSPIIVVDGSEIESISNEFGSRIALPVPVAMTSVNGVHSDLEIERIQKQVEEEQYYDDETLPEETGYEPVAVPVLNPNSRISTTKGLVPPSVIYSMNDIDNLAAEDALAHLDSPVVASTSTASTSSTSSSSYNTTNLVSHEILDTSSTPSTPIFYDDSVTPLPISYTVEEEESVPQFISTEKIATTTSTSTSTSTDENTPIYDEEEEARNWAQYLAAVDAYSSTDSVTTPNTPTERIATTIPIEQSDSTYSEINVDEEASAAYEAYQRAIEGATSSSSSSSSYTGATSERIATTTGSTTDESGAPIYYSEEEDETTAYAKAYAQYEADLITANAGTGSESRIATTSTTTTTGNAEEESSIYYDATTGNYEYRNNEEEVELPQFTQERIATTTSTGATEASTDTYEEELAAYYEALNAVQPEVSQQQESRIATTVDSTSTSTDSTTDSMYYEDSTIGAFETTSDEELHPQFAGNERVAVGSTTSTTSNSNSGVSPENAAAAIAFSSSMIVLQNVFKTYNPLTIEYISPSDPNINLVYVTMIMKARGIEGHSPNVDYTTVLNNKGINPYHGSGNFWTIDISQFCGVFDLLVYESQTINGANVKPYPTTIGRYRITCGVQH